MAVHLSLRTSGGHGVATVVAVRAGRHRFLNVQIRSDVHVRAKSADEVDATIVEWISESFPQFVPKVGEKRRVLFHPVDRCKIAWWEG